MVDQMLGGLFGGPDSDRVRSQAQDFVSRYDQGQPDRFDSREVAENFRTVSRHARPEDMEEAAAQAFSQMSREQRREFRRAMRKRGYRQFERDDDDDDPRVMAQQTQSFMKEQGDQNEGGIEGFLGNLFGRGDDNQQARQQAQAQQNEESILDNPAVKVAMAGMAAFAMKKMMDQQNQG